MYEHDARIRGRAYESWGRGGNPLGRKQEHWYQARCNFDRKESASGTMHDIMVARSEPTDPVAQGRMVHGQVRPHEKRPPDRRDAIADLDETLDALVEAIADNRAEWDERLMTGSQSRRLLPEALPGAAGLEGRSRLSP
jgi:hypothetical protein